MQRCSNCKAPLPPNASFCRQCNQAVLKEAKDNPSAGVTAGAKTLIAGTSPVPAGKKIGTATMIDESALTLPPPEDTGDVPEYEGGGATLFDMGSLGISPQNAEAVVKGGITEVELLGRNIGGYTIDKKLGEGGMGVVYKASHDTGKSIAIKVLHSEFAREPKVLERFFNEAKAVNKMNQPHIVDISDFGFLESGHPYIAMEFLDGCDLAARLEQVCPLPEAEGIDITMQALIALGAAHDVDVIHRDIKPENIFLLKNSRKPNSWFVKVLDFGIAKLSQANTQMTQSGTILGTPRYMSPEQARGEREVGPHADIYSLGVILYELLTGRAPFDEPSYLGYLVAHQRKVPPMPREVNSSISEEVESVVMKCLEKAPNLRYQSAKEMRDALKPCLAKAEANPLPQTMVAAPTPRASQENTFELKDVASPVPVKPQTVEPVKPVEIKPAEIKPIEPPASVLTSKIPVVQNNGTEKQGKGLWIGIGGGVLLVIAAILYFLFFRPS